MTRLASRLSLPLALLLLASGAARAQSASPAPYFSPNGGGAEATAALIDQTTQTLDIAMYSVSTGPSNPIWGALQRAVQRGVKVRFFLDQARGSNKAKADALVGIGAHVFHVGSTTLHEKFAIFDAKLPGAKVVNGSANWSLGAMTKYSENTVVFPRHPHLVKQFADEFDRLLAKGKAYTAGGEQHMQRLNLPAVANASTTERTFFTTQNTAGSTIVGDKIIEVMRTATRSVLIDVAHFNSRSICDALIALKQQKPQLRIEVLVDLGEYADGKSRCKDLERAGIPVRYKTYSLVFLHPRSQLMHHKTLIVDERRVVTGSFNWSDTAENGNYENTMVIEGSAPQNAACVAAFVAEHRKLWDLNRAVYPRFKAAMAMKPTAAGYKPIIPVHFDTPYFDQVMSLTRNEIKPVRAKAFEAGIVERLADGSTKYHNDATYLDRLNKRRHTGPAPAGKFLDPAPPATNPTTGPTNGLTDGVNPPGQ